MKPIGRFTLYGWPDCYRKEDFELQAAHSRAAFALRDAVFMAVYLQPRSGNK